MFELSILDTIYGPGNWELARVDAKDDLRLWVILTDTWTMIVKDMGNNHVLPVTELTNWNKDVPVPSFLKE